MGNFHDNIPYIFMKATVVGIYGAYFQVRLEKNEQEADDVQNRNHTSGKTRFFLAKPRGKLRLTDKSAAYMQPRERHIVTIGDVVRIQFDDQDAEAEANITEIFPRKNSFQRATIYQKQTLGANLNGVIVIASLDYPAFNSGLIARLLVETRLTDIKPILILNKMDYLEKAPRAEYQKTIDIMRYFEKNKYSVFFENLENVISASLRREIIPGRYLAFGESGVGKSTFINQMMGRKIQATDADQIILKGRHVTTNPVLYQLEGDIELIDVPGIREFGLMHRTRFEISRGFFEFTDLQCYYNNCLHLDEPNCGIKSALDSGKFPQFRYEQYCNIMQSMLENWKPRRGDMRNQR